MKDILVGIDRKDWITLRNLYKENSVAHYLAYATIENCIQLIERYPNVKHVNLFCLNGDFSDGTFIMIVSNSHCEFQ